MLLHYLLFEPTDNTDGTGTWDAMASVRASQVDAVRAEVRAVLDWAEAHAPGPRGPLDEGGTWDAHEQVQTDSGWTAVTLTLTGPWAWGEALMAHFTPAD